MAWHPTGSHWAGGFGEGRAAQVLSQGKGEAEGAELGCRAGPALTKDLERPTVLRESKEPGL